MSLKNINSFPRLTKHLVASRAFASEQLTVLDIGARGGFEVHWGCYGDQVKLIGFEADVEECERLNQQVSNSGIRFFPVALHKDRDKKTFYVTALPAASGFYPTDISFCQRFVDIGVTHSVVKTLEMDTVGLDSSASENGISSVDFMKLDTEGCELDILRGATGILKKSLLGLSIEVGFLPLRKDQPVFSDVDSFLRPLGFRLFDLAIYRHARKALPPLTSSPILRSAEQGQVVWGQALYLRDGVSEIESSNLLQDSWDDMKVLKLASIMELFCLPDCAVELIQVAQSKGFLQGRDVDHLIDLLVPSVGRRKATTYNEYVEYLRMAKRRGYLHKFERAKQLAIRILPRPVLLVVHDFLIKVKGLIDEILK